MPAKGSSLVTTSIASELCERIAEGRTLRDVCRDPDIPSYECVYQAMRRNPAFADAIARARLESAHGLAESVVEIADSSDDPAMAQLLRNRCDQRRWLAGKFNPMYADKHTVEHRHQTDAGAMGYDELMSLAASRRAIIEHDAAQQISDAEEASGE